MQRNDLSPTALRQLTRYQDPHHHQVLSLYLDLNPHTTPTGADRSSAITAIVDEALRRAPDKDARTDAERVAVWLQEADFHGSHGVAVFSCEATGLWETYSLPTPISSQVVYADSPWVEPLMDRVEERIGILLIDRRDARFFRGTPCHIDQTWIREDGVPGQHQGGGWSQHRYERSIEEDMRHHLAFSAEAVWESWRAEEFDHFLVACHDRLWPDLEPKLHPYLRERMLDRFHCDVHNTTPDEVIAAAQPTFEAHRQRVQEELVDHVRAGLEHDRASIGLSSTLEAINLGRVESLIYAADCQLPGVYCGTCGWLGEDGSHCPLDDAELYCTTNVIEQAIHAAYRQSAEVHRLTSASIPECIGARLRFALRSELTEEQPAVAA